MNEGVARGCELSCSATEQAVRLPARPVKAVLYPLRHYFQC